MKKAATLRRGGVLLFMLALSGGLRADAVAIDEENSKVIQIIHDEKFYDIDDPVEGAAQMRRNAATIGADTDLRPRYVENLYPDSPTSVVEITLPARFIRPDLADRSFGEFLSSPEARKSGARQYTAIFVMNRNLTINEMASIRESGIRIYQRLNVGLLVRASRTQLLGLAARDYAAWLGEFRDDDKFPRGNRISSFGVYFVRYFGRLKPEYRDDLTSSGAMVTHTSARAGGFSITCGPDVLGAIAHLSWVAAVSPLPAAADDYEEE
jgi:hypothetical protein